MMSEHPQFRLPNLLAQWPWPRAVNKHYEEIKFQFDEWVHSFEALDTKSQKLFDRCNFALLASLGYPLLDKESLLVACELMALFFIYDEYTDTLDEAGARICADAVMDALRNPHKERPQGEPKPGEIAKQFWLHAIKVASGPAQKRLLNSFGPYVYAVVEEAADRDQGRIRGIKDYLDLRVHASAAYCTLFPIEMGLDIPDEVMTHPAMKTFLDQIVYPLCLTNDLYSYNIEQAVPGHTAHNLLTVVMNEKGVDLNGALDWYTEYNEAKLAKSLEQHQKLPSWGPEMDLVVTAFVEGVGYWMRGHDCWSFEAERYFGTKGPEIQKHRMVTLFPKSTEMTPMMARPSAD
ncbi:terpenoid synthase [Lactarius akahatsu]|uniref:Terpene synthase n=1 Tax=Lactarius akahatsu TaxID=416441 RepID=A0AAD4L9E4_9AGAM|nr:terpenoid synthase [Lactarius akahatsu]